MNDSLSKQPLKVLIFSTNPQDGRFFEHILVSCSYAIYCGQVHTWQEFFAQNSAYRNVTAIFLEVNYGLKISSLNILTRLQHHFPGVPVFCYFSDSCIPVIEESILQQGATATLQKPLRPQKITALLYHVWNREQERQFEKQPDAPFQSILTCVQALKTPLDDTELDTLLQTVHSDISSEIQENPDSDRMLAAKYLEELYQNFDDTDLKDSLSVVYHKYHRQLTSDTQISVQQTLSEFLHDCNYIFNYSQKGLNKERINCAKELIHSFLKEGKTVTLNTIADEMFISPYYLSRSFKRVEGINFIDYLQNSRLEYAKLLLSTSDASIETIAFQCGYNEVNSFRRLFRKKTGISPNAYRNSLKQNHMHCVSEKV